MPIERNGKWGVKDYNGNIVVPCKYDRVYNYYEDMAMIELRLYGQPQNGRHPIVVAQVAIRLSCVV